MASALHKRVFGRLTVIELAGVADNRQSIWLCVCRCGQQLGVTQGNLISGNTKSCGCAQDEYRAAISEMARKRRAA